MKIFRTFKEAQADSELLAIHRKSDVEWLGYEPGDVILSPPVDSPPLLTKDSARAILADRLQITPDELLELFTVAELTKP